MYQIHISSELLYFVSGADPVTASVACGCEPSCYLAWGATCAFFPAVPFPFFFTRSFLFYTAGIEFLYFIGKCNFAAKKE